MATTTPNFGWPVPTSTDLVKDGATAIEGLGDAIDASLLDLKGGTTNQVLAKNSNTDMDFKWVSDATGMTNPMTTTGDVIYSSSGSTPARLGLGTAGQVLKVNSGATAPEWGTAAAAGFSWTAYTPTYVNLTLGNGTVSSAYVDTGAEIWWFMNLEFGSTTSISGTVGITSPVNALTSNAGFYFAPSVLATFYDSSAGKMYGAITAFSSTSNMRLAPLGGATGEFGNTEMNASTPFTWATGDKLAFLTHYRKA
jgi:hypothetical protein